MRLALGVLAAAAGGLAFMARRGPLRPRQDRVEHAGPSADRGEPSAHRQPHRAAPCPSTGEQAPAGDERHKRGERVYWCVTGAASIAATGAAIIAAIYAEKAYDTALVAVSENRKQVEAAFAANEISRGTLEAAIGSSVHFTQAEFRFGTDVAEVPRINIQVPIINDGSTATRGLVYGAVCAPSFEHPAEPANRARLREARAYSLTLAPKQTMRPVVCFYTLPKWALIGRHKANVYVYGEATYRDTVRPSETHAVRFCTRLYASTLSASPFNPGPSPSARNADATIAATKSAPRRTPSRRRPTGQNRPPCSADRLAPSASHAREVWLLHKIAILRPPGGFVC